MKAVQAASGDGIGVCHSCDFLVQDRSGMWLHGKGAPLSRFEDAHSLLTGSEAKSVGCFGVFAGVFTHGREHCVEDTLFAYNIVFVGGGLILCVNVAWMRLALGILITRARMIF